MAYAHYALMGGFAANVEDIHNVLERVTLTTNGILFLAKHGYFCRLDRGDIEDKSKADYLAKGLVCIQVLWIVGQSIERKIANLPITLLEVHTIVHVVCVLVMYALGYQKPLNVSCPTLLELGNDRDLLAFALEISAPRRQYKANLLSPRTHSSKYSFGRYGLDSAYNSGFLRGRKAVSGRQLEPDIYLCNSAGEMLEPASLHTSPLTIYQHSFGPDDDLNQNRVQVHEFVPVKGEICCTLVSGQCLDSKIGFYYYKPDRLDETTMQSCKVSLTQKDILRLQFVRHAWDRALASSTGTQHTLEQHLIPVDTEFFRLVKLSEPLHHRSPNVQSGVFFTMLDKQNILLVAALTIIPSAYGGVHICAFGVGFPTKIEGLAWKSSCYFLIAVATTLFVIIASVDLVSKLRQSRPGSFSFWVYKQSRAIVAILEHIKFLFMPPITVFAFLVLFILYCAARMFLVIESFISLRHVPLGIYQMPDLDIMGNIPHI